MTIRGVVHTSFTVADMESSLSFWTEALGFRLVARGPWQSDALGRVVGVPGVKMDIAILEGYGHGIELIACYTPEAEALDVQPHRPLASHLAFDVDDIKATTRTLLDAGASLQGEIDFLDDDPNDSGWAVYLRDPNGIIIELIQAAESAS
jgi:catechol 2,3-dioxygenase-like lactoylglutathione lyase family enzyme